MSNYNSLKTTIDANIKQNGRQEITGQILNSVLNEMVNILGTGYQFAGVAVATIDTKPGTLDAKVFYIANGKGTYTNFGGLEVTEDEVVVLYWDTAWHKEATGIASQAKLTELESETKYNLAIGRIYTSSTDNYLDVENVLDNLRIVDGAFGNNNVGCVISRPIYVGDATVITISGYGNLIQKQICFLTKAEYDNANIVTYYNLTGTQRTITVPTGALYAVVCLKYNSADEDYSSMKLSKSANVATQAFANVYLGQAGQESFFAKTILTTDALADYGTPNANLPGKALSPQTKLQYMQPMSLDGKKLLAFNAVYGSTTDNYLDLSNLIYGLRIKNIAPYIECHNDAITSRLIPVRGAQKITISGIGKIGPCALLFLDCIATSRTDWYYNLETFTQRTIDVPSWANFIIIGLQYDASFAGGYTNMKVSLSDVPATGEFTPRFVGYADNPESWDNPQEDDILTQSFIKKAEINETERRGIPFAFSSQDQSSPAAHYQYEI